MATLLSPRRVRVLLVHSRRWQRRAIFIVGGLAVGLAAVGLAVASDQMQSLFHQVAARRPYLPLVLTPLGLGVAVFLTRYFPNTQGSGIPQAIAARNLKRDDERSRLVGLRVAVGK